MLWQDHRYMMHRRLFRHHPIRRNGEHGVLPHHLAGGKQKRVYDTMTISTTVPISIGFLPASPVLF